MPSRASRTTGEPPTNPSFSLRKNLVKFTVEATLEKTSRQVICEDLIILGELTKKSGRKTKPMVLGDQEFVFPESEDSPIEPAKAYRDSQELLKNAKLPKVCAFTTLDTLPLPL